MRWGKWRKEGFLGRIAQGFLEVVSPLVGRFKPGCEIQIEFRDIRFNPAANDKKLIHISAYARNDISLKRTRYSTLTKSSKLYLASLKIHKLFSITGLMFSGSFCCFISLS